MIPFFFLLLLSFLHNAQYAHFLRTALCPASLQDADMIAQRASLRTDDSDAPLAEQSISQAIAAASDQLKKHFAG